MPIDQTQGTASAPSDNGMTPAQMKSDLKQQFAGVESARKASNAKQIVGQNNLESLRGDIIRSIFEAMQQYGVDVTNPESIRSFLAELEANDPDLYDLFDIAFSSLTGQSDQGQAPGGPSDLQNLGSSPMMGAMQPPPGNTPGGSPFAPFNAPPSPIPDVPPSPSSAGPGSFPGIAGAMNG